VEVTGRSYNVFVFIKIGYINKEILRLLTFHFSHKVGLSKGVGNGLGEQTESLSKKGG